MGDARLARKWPSILPCVASLNSPLSLVSRPAHFDSGPTPHSHATGPYSPDLGPPWSPLSLDSWGRGGVENPGAPPRREATHLAMSGPAPKPPARARADASHSAPPCWRRAEPRGPDRNTAASGTVEGTWTGRAGVHGARHAQGEPPRVARPQAAPALEGPRSRFVARDHRPARPRVTTLPDARRSDGRGGRPLTRGRAGRRRGDPVLGKCRGALAGSLGWERPWAPVLEIVCPSNSWTGTLGAWVPLTLGFTVVVGVFWSGNCLVEG